MSAESHKHHILPLRVYLTIGSLLIGLTIVTVWVASYDLGEFNLIVAMIIAATKAMMVALFFMHLKYDNKFYSLIFGGSILFLAAFIIFTMFDTMNRDNLDAIRGQVINKDAIIYQVDTTTAAADSATLDTTALPTDSTSAAPAADPTH